MLRRSIGAGTLAVLAGSAIVVAGGCATLTGAPPPGPALPAAGPEVGGPAFAGPEVAGPEVAGPEVAGRQFDGVYVGRNAAVEGWGFLCGGSTYPETITVSGGRFDYPFQVNPPRTTPIAVQIAADGTFAAQMQYGTEEPGPRSRYITAWVTVSGRVAAGVLDATVADLRCVRRLTARRR
jgi:hypothetical protein